MKKENRLMLINETSDETRIAIANNRKLEEFQAEQKSKINLRGNIYKAKVVQIEPSLEAAFIDYGGERNGFLAFDEINFSLFPKLNGKKDGILQRLKIGQPLMVQATREPIGNKGASLTTFISLVGRQVHYLPNQKTVSLHKKITRQRAKLESFLVSLLTEGNGAHLVGEATDLKALNQEILRMNELWQRIEQDFLAAKRPGLIYQELDLSLRMIRDYYNDAIDAIWIDNPDTFHKVYGFFSENFPEKMRDINLFNKKEPILHFFGVEEEIETLSKRSVSLASGGTIVIDPTEALVAIDVNSAKSVRGANNEETALKTNLEAAEEIARQLKLRNLGGLIVVDFIDMQKKDWIKKVETTFYEAMEDDKAQHNLGKISNFGLLELSRQRLHQGYAASVEVSCPFCMGTGKNFSKIAFANQILRQLKALAAEKKLANIQVKALPAVSDYLLNEKRAELSQIEREFGIQVFVHSHEENLSFDQAFEVTLAKFSSQALAEEQEADRSESYKKPARETTRQTSRPRYATHEPRANGSEEMANGTTPRSYAPHGPKREDSRRRGSFSRPPRELVMPEVLLGPCFFGKALPVVAHFPWLTDADANLKATDSTPDKDKIKQLILPEAFTYKSLMPLHLI